MAWTRQAIAWDEMAWKQNQIIYGFQMKIFLILKRKKFAYKQTAEEIAKDINGIGKQLRMEIHSQRHLNRERKVCLLARINYSRHLKSKVYLKHLDRDLIVKRIICIRHRERWSFHDIIALRLMTGSIIVGSETFFLSFFLFHSQVMEKMKFDRLETITIKMIWIQFS